MSESFFYANLFESFEIWTPTDLSPTEIESCLDRAATIHLVLQDLLNGKISLSQYLEFVDSLDIDVDSYVDEIEQNLESTPLIYLR